MNRLFIGLILVSLSSCQQPVEENPVGVLGEHAMVVTAHPLATQAGIRIIEQGGNAFDAATTIHFMLAVVYPRAGNIGGGGFAVIRHQDGEIAALDFREMAPSEASETMYQDENGDIIKDKSTLGHYAPGIPGSVAGIWELHQKHGSIPWDHLVQPAIDVAFNGFKITLDEAMALNEKQSDFRKANHYQPWPIKDEWKENDVIVQKQLAATLSFIRDRGRNGFYKGIVAEQIVNEIQREGGIISKDDLINYRGIWRDPVVGTYKNHKIIGMPPPSSGGIAILQLLQGAEQLNLGQYEHNSVEAIHLMAELERRVFADRAMHLGDPDYFKVPQTQLLNPEYNLKRFESITMDRASTSETIQAGNFQTQESMETTHYSIVDDQGNAISITTTLNGNYGSKVLVQGAGFFLNNEMDDFSAKPGVKNMFGLIGGKANAIAPGKRMLSSMTPTIVEKDGQLKMVLGTPGGPTIITSVFQTIINVIDHKMSMQKAVSSKKVHHQWIPDRILVEEGALTDEQIEKLQSMGHHIEFRDKIGRTDCILIRDDGQLEGGADYTRGDDYAEGF